ncbi:lipopolysaccharide biosynthesis protein [Terrisporobacter mayombei]|uniref:lipopolysaccharide biosynthesis protein n=1 Tax=Terrisporobacter mayombei TaxID=1541 RepID=UPI00265B2870|nr:lipopolysaccharide biosynthesis protein [Terrisporobacter mayombei]MCC3670618.1 lipopolysaccharide biosynthesis protein [Terrisporobacter mayombei]
MKDNISKKINSSLKWSSITEIIAKLIQPITNMILARILVPEAFGVVATVNMIISFADMFTDAGFQKYIVQQEFKDESDREISTNVAFWTNLSISLILWVFIIIFSEEISTMVGNPGLGIVISVACMQLPLTSFSSIQMAIYRRNFDFRTLFFVRIISICIPFIVTIPLALFGYSYWSLIVGSICGTLSNAIILTLKSVWRPKLEYSLTVLKEMLSFSLWSLLEAISIWLTTWIDTFIIGSALSSYYLGIYKTSLSTVNSIFMIVTGATTPILFSALCRVQNDDKEFKNVLFSMQKNVSYLVLPMSVGIFVFSDLVVKILLGNNWGDANYIIGLWGITQGITIVLSHYSSEVYRAKGKPRLSFIAQVIFLLVLIPVCYIYSKYEFKTFVTVRGLVRLVFILIHFVLMKYIIGISIKEMTSTIKLPIVASVVMGCIGYLLSLISKNILWQIISILICIISYFIILMCFKSSRYDILNIINKFGIVEKAKNIKILKVDKMIIKDE